ncbi:hypothetical protein M3Y97_00668700 [Aphelenchoides bicaudatus]|nr:hypothetical protein M3Y97_00668700 [Aphelenchoides bicaudatus]
MFNLLIFASVVLIQTALAAEQYGTLAVRPFTVHFFNETFGRNLTHSETVQYLHVFSNYLISKEQAKRKLDSIAHEKGDGFEKSYLKWKEAQEKHNIQWWQVNDSRMHRKSPEAQQLYEAIKSVHFNKTLSFREDCHAYNQLIETASKSTRNELEWPTLNCTIDIPDLNPHGRLNFKLIL